MEATWSIGFKVTMKTSSLKGKFAVEVKPSEEIGSRLTNFTHFSPFFDPQALSAMTESFPHTTSGTAVMNYTFQNQK